jgi:hypothetical protein
VDLSIREATDDDAGALAAFTCSMGAWYEDEVQAYVRSTAMVHAREKHGYRLLTAYDGVRLVAVMAHADEALTFPDGDTWVAARLQVLAIACNDRGRSLGSRGRLSDVLIATLISDAMERHRTDLVTAIVAAENARSLSVCERNGLRSQIRYSPGYVRLTARMRRR